MSQEKQEKNSKKNDKASDVFVEETTIKLDNIDKIAVQTPVDDKNDKLNEIIQEYNGETNTETIDLSDSDITSNEEEKTSKNMQLNKKKIIMFVIMFVIVISFAVMCIVNKTNSKVYYNILLNGKDLSNMSVSEVTEYLKEEQTALNRSSLKILQGEEEILKIVPSDIGLEIDITSVEKEVFDYGRDSNIFKNNFDIVYASIFKKEFELKYKYDPSKLSEIVKEIKESLKEKVIQDSYIVDENDYMLIITKGKSGNTIEEEIVKEQIISKLSSGDEEYVLEVVTSKPDNLDIDVVYSNVKKAAKDAYIDKTTSVYKFVPHQVGIEFDKEDLKEVLSKEENKVEGKVIEYKLTTTEPAVKTSDIKWDFYEYKISSYTTYFATSDQNRVNNLKVALNLLNGKVIMPGETFSYNSVVGAATSAQGFKPAATFMGGRIVKEVGGGICQTVSTLYNTALLANLEIVQRKAHSLPVAYVPASRDATVYYPSIDFKFKNTRSYPVKIVTSFNSGGNLTIALYGTKEENEYDISISSKKTSTISFTTQYTNNSSMDKGTQKVVQSGSNGYTSEAYITKKLNGKVVSTTLLSKDTYKAVNQIVNIGTKEVVQTPVQEPATTPEGTENVNQNTTTNSES